MNNTMKTTVPFSGFYYSMHDDAINREIEYICTSEEDGEIDTEKHDALMEDYDHGVVMEQYAKAYCGHVSHEMKIPLKFDHLCSPSEYNFRTDVIYAEIATDDVIRMLGSVTHTTLDEIAHRRFTTRSGFISFYDPDYRTWGNVAEWDQNQVGTLIEAYQIDCCDWDDDAEFDIVETLICNGYVTTMIECAIGDEFWRVHG